MVIIGLAGCGVEAVSSTKRELKEPRDGRLIGSTCFTDYSDAQRVRFSRSCRSFHPVGSPFTGLFLSGPCHGGECMAPLRLGHGQRRYGSGESAINVRAITQPLARDKQTCPARGMRNSSAMPEVGLDVTRCHNPRITRRQAQRTGPPIALTRQGV